MDTFVHEEQFRGNDLLDKMATQHFCICGVGAIGSNLVETMVRQGFCKFTVIDFDRVENHNRHTQIFDSRDVGQLKVNALKSKIFNIMGVVIEAISSKLDDKNIRKVITGDSIVIDCFDNMESRALLTDYCGKNNILCLHTGLYKGYGEVHWNPGYRVPQPVKGADVCEYPLARNIVLLTVTVAVETLIRYLDTGVFEQYSITLDDLKVESF